MRHMVSKDDTNTNQIKLTKKNVKKYKDRVWHEVSKDDKKTIKTVKTNLRFVKKQSKDQKTC